MEYNKSTEQTAPLKRPVGRPRKSDEYKKEQKKLRNKRGYEATKAKLKELKELKDFRAKYLNIE
jgi:hypothetical protein